MPAARKDFYAEQGATFSRTLTWRDAAGALVDLTGYSAKMQVRAAYGAAEALLDLNTDNSGVVLGGPAGTIQILAADEQTAAITVPDTGDIPPKLFAVYDLVLVAPDGSVARKLQGQFIVARRVSV
jgi:hypothetical protein